MKTAEDLLYEWLCEASPGCVNRFDDGEWHYIDIGNWDMHAPEWISFDDWLEKNGYKIISTKDEKHEFPDTVS